MEILTQKMKSLEFLIDNIFDEFGGQFFQQVVGIPIGASCATLPVDLFLNSYETEFMQKLIKNNNTEANAFNLIFMYIFCQ